MSEKKKPKSIKMEWKGSLTSFSNDQPISIKGSDSIKSNTEKKAAEKINGKVNIRKETKGRAGKPVAILFDFSDREAKNEESLKQLCSQLKSTLGCGGTTENGEIILTLRDFNILKETLLKLGIIVK